MSSLIDLHMHTNHSDGKLDPERLLRRVRAKKLAGFAVTDHDTIRGYRALIPLMKRGDPELVPGLELSVAAEDDDMHMLAYFFDPDSDVLNEALQRFQTERNRRGQIMVEKLQELGVDLPFSEVQKTAGNSALGRPHVAEAMVNLGLVSSFDEAFKKHIGNNGPAYVPKSKIGPGETIDLVHRAGGIAVLAHPFINKMYRHLDELISLNLDGLEVYHYSHSKHQVRELIGMAKQKGLLMTGGSDFHGRLKYEGDIGCCPVPADYLEAMRQKAETIRGLN